MDLSLHPIICNKMPSEGRKPSDGIKEQTAFYTYSRVVKTVLIPARN
ncbi:hypothetical protein NEICINOT_03075 [Neisseria cinerea ATCC 14685]|uniref:Uncharacterized protein n=1 Tax=Neisseria cinerea ATCC 14685 TaxID=546262 RepID=D0W0A8_NEICI|nr:hypothetical protein NEICINOT_03075 [Neisseria cinerea ATCC 14685]